MQESEQRYEESTDAGKRSICRNLENFGEYLDELSLTEPFEWVRRRSCGADMPSFFNTLMRSLNLAQDPETMFQGRWDIESKAACFSKLCGRL